MSMRSPRRQGHRPGTGTGWPLPAPEEPDDGVTRFLAIGCVAVVAYGIVLLGFLTAAAIIVKEILL